LRHGLDEEVASWLLVLLLVLVIVIENRLRKDYEDEDEDEDEDSEDGRAVRCVTLSNLTMNG
jgi:hypothetical protein